MRYDWSPLWRSTIGFDRLFDVFDEAQRTTEDKNVWTKTASKSRWRWLAFVRKKSR
jgi:hypothetical protein